MKKIFILVLILAALAGGYLYVSNQGSSIKTNNSPRSVVNPAPKQADFNTDLYSHTDPTSIWVLVNKRHPLQPKTYIPKDLVFPTVPLRVPGNETMQLRRVAAAALEKLFEAAAANNTPLMLSSGYRSYSYQLNLYNGYVASQGQAVADQQSARPGYSEHQTGLAADVEPLDRTCEVEQCFANTPAGQWLAANAYRYGFIIRYPKGGQPITGYEYEPWHIRYIGVAATTAMHKQKVLTLEQFFNAGPAPTY